jgi:UDP-glucose:(heptosyl)LPS alpha-1,3-glucosyltransferase
VRIAVACGSFKVMGGRERDCLAVAAGLARLGHGVTLVTSLAPANDVPGVEVVKVPVNGLSNHTRAADFSRAFGRWRGASPVDFSLGFDRMEGLDFFYCADQPRPVHAGWRGLLPRNRTYRRLERAIFGPGSRTHVFFLAEPQRENYARVYGSVENGSEILPVTLQRAAPAVFYERRDALRAQLGIAPDALLLINVAAYGRQKGVDRLLATLPDLPPAQFLSVGIDDPSEFRSQAGSLGVEDRVHFLPYSDDVAGLIGAADLMVHPARAETTGNVIVESLLYGVPVMCSAICGYSTHVVQSGGGVVLSEPFRPEELRDSLRQWTRPRQLEELRARARAYSAVLAALPGMEGVVRRIEAAMQRRLRGAR